MGGDAPVRWARPRSESGRGRVRAGSCLRTSTSAPWLKIALDGQNWPRYNRNVRNCGLPATRTRRLRRFLKALVAPVLFGSAAVPASAQHHAARPPLSTAQIAAASTAAVVLLRTYDAAGKPVALGSGFLLSDGRVATNAHVLAGASSVEVVASDGRLLLTAQAADVVNERVDVAILPRVVRSPRTLALGDDLPAVGTKVVVIGAPEGLTNTVSDGIVSSVRTVGGRQLLQVSAPISHGSSGGPVLDESGRVVGMATAFVDEGQNLNFAVTATDIAVLAASPAGKYAFPPADNSVASAASQSAPASGATSSRPLSLADLLAYVGRLPLLGTEWFGRTSVQFYGCVRGAAGSGIALCVLRITNTEPSESSRFFFQGAGLVDANGIVASPNILWFLTANRTFPIVSDWNIVASEQDLVGIAFNGVATGSGPTGQFVMRAHAGWTGQQRTVTFSNAFVPPVSP